MYSCVCFNFIILACKTILINSIVEGFSNKNFSKSYDVKGLHFKDKKFDSSVA